MFVLLMTVLALHLGQTGEDQSLLWKISRPSTQESYLFGTIHLQDTTVFRQRDTALALMASCSTFAAELHLDSAARMMMSPGVIMLPSGTLYDMIDSATVQRLMVMVDERMPGFSAIVPRIKPGALTAILSMSSEKPTASEAMDVFLWNRAKRSSQSVVGLEYVSEQLQLLDTMGVDGLLRIINDSTDASSRDLRRMIDAYSREDLQTLAAMASDSSMIARDELRSLNDDRNYRIVDRMIPLLARGRTFVAVGALHLTGPASIIALLRERGWTVQPVIGGGRSQWLMPSAMRTRRN